MAQFVNVKTYQFCFLATDAINRSTIHYEFLCIRLWLFAVNADDCLSCCNCYLNL